MKKYFYFPLLFVGFLSLFVTNGTSQRMPQKLQTKPFPDLQQVNNQFAAQGLRFTENKGQVADLNGRLRPDILFTAQNEGVKLFLTANGIHYQFRREFAKPVQDNKMVGKSELEVVDSTQFYRLDLSLKGANPNPKVIKDGVGVDVENFFLAHCPDGITGVKNYNRITYKEVYPNIDWVVYVKEGMLEYDFVVRPGGDIDDIQLQYKGAENLTLDKAGELHIKTPLGKVTEQRPFSFQQEGSEVSSNFVVKGNIIGFEVPEYNENKALTIDPSIVWATYYGGSGNDGGNAVAVDGSGNVYLAGTTVSTNGIASGGFQNSKSGLEDAFLVKFNPAGARLWATYYGGPDIDYVNDCMTDANGNVYLVGSTLSETGIASGGFQNVIDKSWGNDIQDAYLVKFNETGQRIWATYYGGKGTDDGYAGAVDALGNIYLAGPTEGSDNLASGGFLNIYPGDIKGFLVKFGPDGSRIWATYYGGNAYENVDDCATDYFGNVYLSGFTWSSSGIASGGFQNELNDPNGNGYPDLFLVKFNGNGNRLWATYYGGEGNEIISSCETDAAGNVFLAGQTSSTSGIGYNGFQMTLSGDENSFLVKFNPAGERIWATYYGGPGLINNGKCAVHTTGNSFLYGGSQVVKFDPAGNKLWTNSFPGSIVYGGKKLVVDVSGKIYYAGNSSSTTNTASGGYQNLRGGLQDAFLVKIQDDPPLDDGDGDGVPDANDCALNDNTKYRTANLYIDTDNDGYDAGQENICYGATIPSGYKSTTLGSDCDDANNAITGPRTWYKDSDDDGYSDGTILVQCNHPEDYKLPANLVALSGDCNETNGSIHPGATEICDGLDNNCDGVGDEGADVTWYKDADNDGFSDGSTLVQCFKPVDYKPVADLSATSGDCNDANAAINPAATEVCDGIDNNCNALTDEGTINTWYKDADNDGYSDGLSLTQCTQPAGYKLSANLTATSGDCNDSKAAIHPGAPELCDGLDNDCNAQTDEGCPVGTAWYFDYDKDGYGNPNKVVYAVTQPYKYVANSGDCRDWNAAFHPGATELCDGLDNDCDGLVDEGCPSVKTWYRDGDGDGFGNSKYTKTRVYQPAGFVGNDDDCKDWDANVYPGHGCPPVTGMVGTEGVTIQPKAMLEASAEMRVFPNPARDEITVTIDGFEVGKKVELQMIQADGKVVSGQSITPFTQSQQVRMNVSKLHTGYYLLQVRQGLLQQTRKVMIVQ